ncbi:MAG: hypothetical protein R3F56_18560 [Planctomycetota bacterium]
MARKARALDGFRSRTRRQFAVAGLLGFASAVGAFFLGRTAAPESQVPGSQPPNPDPRLALGYRLASASDQDLFEAAATFLVVLDGNRRDAALWTGWSRLARMATERSDVTRAALAKRLLKSAAAAPVPAFVDPLVSRLRQRAR